MIDAVLESGWEFKTHRDLEMVVWAIRHTTGWDKPDAKNAIMTMLAHARCVVWFGPFARDITLDRARDITCCEGWIPPCPNAKRLSLSHSGKRYCAKTTVPESVVQLIMFWPAAINPAPSVRHLEIYGTVWPVGNQKALPNVRNLTVETTDLVWSTKFDIVHVNERGVHWGHEPGKVSANVQIVAQNSIRQLHLDAPNVLVENCVDVLLSDRCVDLSVHGNVIPRSYAVKTVRMCAPTSTTLDDVVEQLANVPNTRSIQLLGQITRPFVPMDRLLLVCPNVTDVWFDTSSVLALDPTWFENDRNVTVHLLHLSDGVDGNL